MSVRFRIPAETALDAETKGFELLEEALRKTKQVAAYSMWSSDSWEGEDGDGAFFIWVKAEVSSRCRSDKTARNSISEAVWASLSGLESRDWDSFAWQLMEAHWNIIEPEVQSAAALAP